MTDASTPFPQRPQARCFALLPCAGTGSRAGTAGPKQYEPLLGVPLVLHTLAAFQAVQRIERVLVVVSPADRFLSIDDPLGDTEPTHPLLVDSERYAPLRKITNASEKVV